MPLVRGSLWVYLLYDVADEIDLARLRSLLAIPAPQREPSFRLPAPDYVRFENPPLVQSIAVPDREGVEGARGRLRYYDYGVISLELELPFEAGFDQLVRLSHRWMGSADLERWAGDVVRSNADRVQAAFENRYERFLTEDYYIVHVREALDDSGHPLTAAALIAQKGIAIAQIVRGEAAELAPGEQQEVLASRLSYYPTDLLVVAWGGAFVYDPVPGGIEPTLRILEYANSQLLQFRYYDEVLTRVMSRVYKRLERRGGFWSRWHRVREAQRLNAMRLDVTELSERTDNAIKFLSDMFYARAYKLASEKVGVNDYRNLVDEKLRTAAELYESMVNEFHQSRAFVLELMVVIILIIDLIALFTGKTK